MSTLVVLGGTVVLATASVYYLSRIASAKRDSDAKGESVVHNSCCLRCSSTSPPYPFLPSPLVCNPLDHETV